MSHPSFSEQEDKKRERSIDVSALDPGAESLSQSLSGATLTMSHVPLTGLALPQSPGASASAASAAKNPKPEWKSLEKPLAPGTDSEFGNVNLTDEELSKHKAVIATITDYLAAKDERPVLLYFGVGVGNPDNAFGSNPTAKPNDRITEKDQENPGFLQDARSQKAPYRTLSVLYQTTGSKDVKLTEQGDGQACISIDLRFPLGRHEIVQDYVKVAKGAARVVVLNAVTDTPYEGLLVLAKAKPKMESAYVSSYMETGRTKAYNWPVPAKATFPPLVNETGKAATMADVFNRDAQDE